MNKHQPGGYRPVSEKDKQLLRDVASWLFGWPNMLVWMIPLLILLSLLGAGR